MITDIRYALRLLFKTPLFTILTLAIVALGLALSIYTYSFLHSLIAKQLPLQGGASMVKMYAERDGESRMLDAYELAELRDKTPSLTDIAAYIDRNVVISGPDGARSLLATYSEWNIFDFTAVRPMLGRGFMPGDNADGAEPVAVLSYKVWQSVFASDPKVIDSLTTINAVSTRVIGVMPEGYGFPLATDLWLPLARRVIDPATRSIEQVNGYARITPGATLERANTEIETTLRGLSERAGLDRQLLPDGGYAMSFPEAQMGDALPLFAALYIVTALIFVLVCTNVGNLLLSRANERARETSIRVALGAPRRRLVLQMMWESILISVVGGVLALLLAGWGLELTNLWANTNLADNLAFWWSWGMDAHTVQLGIVFILLTILLVGALPAWRATKGDFNAVLRDGGRGGQGRKAGRTTRLLIVLEVLLISVVMFVGSVMAVAAYRATHIDRGVDVSNLMMASITLPQGRYKTAAERVSLFERTAANLSSQPNIKAVMLKADIGRKRTAVEGVEYKLDTDYPVVYGNSISGSIETLGIKLVAGRDFDSRDDATGLKTIIVTESFAKRDLGGVESALGRRIRFFDPRGEEPWRTVVGICTDVVEGEPMSRSSSTLGMYIPLVQSEAVGVNVLFRHSGNDLAARTAMYRALYVTDQAVVASSIASYEEILQKIALLATAVTELFMQCGLFALVLAVTGVYCLIANSINQRSKEIGVWRALGATDGRVVRTFMMEGLRLLLIGLALGLVVAAAMSLVFFRVLALDPFIYGLLALAVPITIVIVVLAAIYTPVHRSVSLEPIAALRHD